MIRGLYVSTSGLVATQQRIDELAGNVSNVSTTGFKEVLATQEDASTGVSLDLGLDGGPVSIGQVSYGTVAVGATVNRDQGPLVATGKATDLAISGDGLFVVGTPSGVAYTRAGDFNLDASGTLTTQDGYPVLDTAGRPVTVPAGAAAFSVSPDGTVAGTGQRLAFIAFPATGVAIGGENLYRITGPVQPVAAGAGTIAQGSLEASNVDLASSMTELIAMQRLFQFSARSLTLQDQTLQDANSVGSVK